MAEEVQDTAEIMMVEKVVDSSVVKTDDSHAALPANKSVLSVPCDAATLLHKLWKPQREFTWMRPGRKTRQLERRLSNSEMSVNGSNDRASSNSLFTRNLDPIVDEYLATYILKAVKENDNIQLLQVLKRCKENQFPKSRTMAPSCWSALYLAIHDERRKECLESLLEYRNGILISLDGRIAKYVGRKRDVEENILLLLQKSYELHHKPAGQSILHVASYLGKSKMVSFLLNHSANVNIKDCRQVTPLHLAAEMGRLQASRILLANGANVHSADHLENLPLHYACSQGSIDLIRLLLEHDLTTINCQNHDGYLPLLCALNRTNEVSVIDYLLEKGARTDIVGDSGETIFDFAAAKRRFDLFPLLAKSVSIKSVVERYCLDIVQKIETPGLDSKYNASLTSWAIDKGAVCLTDLVNCNLPEAVLQAPSSIYYSTHNYARVFTPLAYLFDRFYEQDDRFDPCLDILLKHKITKLDEFRREARIDGHCCNIKFVHPFSKIFDDTASLPEKLPYFYLLTANDVTIDYCLQCFCDNTKSFATFADYHIFYEPVMQAIKDCKLKTLKLFVSTSAILEPDLLIQYVIGSFESFDLSTNDLVPKTEKHLLKSIRMLGYLFSLEPTDPLCNYFNIGLPRQYKQIFPETTLQQRCRTVIRKQLREPTLMENLLNFRRKILELPLPLLLKDFLLFKT